MDLNNKSYPYQSYSWVLESSNVAIKKMDKSTFLHRGTSIPNEIRSFFGAQYMKYGNKKEISLLYADNIYKAQIEVVKSLSRTRLLWKSDFAEIIKSFFTEIYSGFSRSKKLEEYTIPCLKFERDLKDSNRYLIEFIDPLSISVIQSDIDSEELEILGARTEGAVSFYYGRKYERDLINRLQAINLHGTSCVICGFNFEETYGDRGANFIEVHHVKPLNVHGHEIVIDPQTDLIPVCANCHRMIHRKQDKILSIEEMKTILKSR